MKPNSFPRLIFSARFLAAALAGIAATRTDAGTFVSPDHIVGVPTLPVAGALLAIDTPRQTTIPLNGPVGPTWSELTDRGWRIASGSQLEADHGVSPWEPDGTVYAQARNYRINGNPGSSYTFNLADAGIDLPNGTVVNAETLPFVWTQTAGGAQAWPTDANWQGSLAPSHVSGDTIDFSTVNIAADTALALFALAAPARAGTVTSSSGAPVINGADLANCGAVSSTDKGASFQLNTGINFDRNTVTKTLDWAFYQVMQTIVDEIYAPHVILTNEALLDRFQAGRHGEFPRFLRAAGQSPGQPHGSHQRLL